ncbi:uncharacterized protein LOC129872735 [Solanum dulcamara]|uniref:uncharacterized protein LOC129872735 n=1 Tax=Solanum dulcamara TaxID=45834 RepID=UPI00248644B2|nr:uncharacterized protein LOC129872735 [Solanum dulcamara]
MDMGLGIPGGFIKKMMMMVIGLCYRLVVSISLHMTWRIGVMLPDTTSMLWIWCFTRWTGADGRNIWTASVCNLELMIVVKMSVQQFEGRKCTPSTFSLNVSDVFYSQPV